MGDVDGDGRLEVCFTAGGDGNLYCLNGEDGSILWAVESLGGDFPFP